MTVLHYRTPLHPIDHAHGQSLGFAVRYPDNLDDDLLHALDAHMGDHRRLRITMPLDTYTGYLVPGVTPEDYQIREQDRIFAPALAHHRSPHPERYSSTYRDINPASIREIRYANTRHGGVIWRKPRGTSQAEKSS